jgi:GMP synthase (glutamine-hydrolysing)
MLSGEMRRVVIVKTGTAVEPARHRGDFEHWIADGMGVAHEALHTYAVHEDEPLPAHDEPHAVVVTGSASMVTSREPWSERTAQWLRLAVDAGRPVLGICYGHQLLAHALGGVVDDNPHGRHIGTADVHPTEHASGDPLLGSYAAHLHVPVSHSQVVRRLPEGATPLARAAVDDNHAFRFGRNAWGVQFHPEWDAEIVRAYISHRRQQIEAEGLDPDALSNDARDTEDGPALLRRFAALARG